MVKVWRYYVVYRVDIIDQFIVYCNYKLIVFPAGIKIKMTDSCDAVERELDKVLQKFGCVSEHFNRTIDKQIEFIKALKQQFEEGESSVIIIIIFIQ